MATLTHSGQLSNVTRLAIFTGTRGGSKRGTVWQGSWRHYESLLPSARDSAAQRHRDSASQCHWAATSHVCFSVGGPANTSPCATAVTSFWAAAAPCFCARWHCLMKDSENLVQAFVTSSWFTAISYYQAAPNKSLKTLQLIQNAAARVLTRTRKRESIFLPY